MQSILISEKTAFGRMFLSLSTIRIITNSLQILWENEMEFLPVSRDRPPVDLIHS